jgi:hypothetical protein
MFLDFKSFFSQHALNRKANRKKKRTRKTDTNPPLREKALWPQRGCLPAGRNLRTRNSLAATSEPNR